MTITAVGVTRYGGPEVLHPVRLPEPLAGAGQVRVQVRTAGVNPVDAMMRTGLLAGAYEGVHPPYVPGMEVAGTIDEVGERVDPTLGLSTGLRVVAVAGAADEELVRGFGARDFVPRGADVPGRVRALVPDGVDAVADAATLGGAVVPAVRDGGQIGSLRGWDAPVERGIVVHRLNVRQRATDAGAIATLRDLAEEGALALRVAEVFPATRAPHAHTLLDAGGVRGRLVLDLTALGQ